MVWINLKSNWKKKQISADKKSQQELITDQTRLKQSKDIPDYYRDLAMRIGVNPIDLANSQLGFYTDEKIEEKTEEQKYNDKILNLIYKFPTRFV